MYKNQYMEIDVHYRFEYEIRLTTFLITLVVLITSRSKLILFIEIFQSLNSLQFQHEFSCDAFSQKNNLVQLI